MASYIAREVEKLADNLGIDRKRSIGEVAKELKVKTHVIRFWEENFPQIKPEIGAGKRRYYYNKQVKILKQIKKFLYEDGYTIAGLQKILRRKKSDGSDVTELDESMFVNDEAVSKNEKSVNFGQKDEIDLDDFILKTEADEEENLEEENNVKAGSSIDLSSRLLDFSNIKISAIDPTIKKEVTKRISAIRSEISKLRALAT